MKLNCFKNVKDKIKSNKIFRIKLNLNLNIRDGKCFLSQKKAKKRGEPQIQHFLTLKPGSPHEFEKGRNHCKFSWQPNYSNRWGPNHDRTVVSPLACFW